MQLNLDFCFTDGGGLVAVAGWTTQPRPDLCLHVDDAVLTPVLVSRHIRRDLRSAEPFGVIALFDLSQASVRGDLAAATIHLGNDGDFAEIRPDRLPDDALRLVQIGVDEVFFALLRLMGQGWLALGEGEIAAEICTRLRMLPSAPRETEDFVLAVDRCQHGGTGQGAVVGWFMPASAVAEPLCALALDDQMIVPVDLLPGSMARADLVAYAPRYRFTGRDGYCGGWRFPRPPVGNMRLLIMVPGQPFVPGVVIMPEQVQPADLAQQATIASLGIDDIASRARLRRAMLPATLPAALPQDLGTTPDSGQDDTLLVLDHDLADSDLRDVLRRLGPHLPGPLRLHLLRPQLTAPLLNGIDGAAREMPRGISLAAVAMQIAPADPMPGRVLFARSASLFQFDPAALLAPHDGLARVTILDPIGSVMAQPAAQASRFARDLLPFALSMQGPAFFQALEQIPHCFLTQEARLRLLVEALIAANAVTLQRADIFGFFEGKSGPHCQGFADGRDWHAYDAESRQLIQGGLAA